MLVCSGAVAAMFVLSKPFQLLLYWRGTAMALDARDWLVSLHASLPSRPNVVVPS